MDMAIAWGNTCESISMCPYQPFAGRDAGKMDDLQVSRLRDQRVRRQGDNVITYPR